MRIVKVLTVSLLLLLISSVPIGAKSDKVKRPALNHLVNAPIEAFKPLPKPKPKVVFKNMGVPRNYNAYAWMPYTAITNKRSRQYFYRVNARTDADGFRRYNGKILVAMGQYYGRTGDELRITMSTGLVYDVIIGDSKGIRHTDSTRRVCTTNGSIVEFIVDKGKFNNGKLNRFSGAIIKIEKRVK